MERNQDLVRRIKKIKADHPFWGYRRVWATLRYREGMMINKKRVQRLMQMHGLVVKRNTGLKAKRTCLRPKPRPRVPNECWGIDMTKVLVDGCG